MTLTQLKNRQQTLLNLISSVGGRNNVRKWLDELTIVEAQIEELEAVVPQVQVVYVDDIDHLCQPWVVIVGGKEIASFATRAKCDRHLAWHDLVAA